MKPWPLEARANCGMKSTLVCGGKRAKMFFTSLSVNMLAGMYLTRQCDKEQTKLEALALAWVTGLFVGWRGILLQIWRIGRRQLAVNKWA